MPLPLWPIKLGAPDARETFKKHVADRRSRRRHWQGRGRGGNEEGETPVDGGA